MLSDSFCEGTPTDDEGHSSGLSCVCPQGCGRQLKTNDVADADRVSVMPFAVRSYFCNVAICGHCPIAVDDVVIPDSLEAPLLVPSSDVLHGEVLSFGSSRAMDDNLVDFSHDFGFSLTQRFMLLDMSDMNVVVK